MIDPGLSNPPKTLDEARTQIEQLWGIVGRLESLVTDLNAKNEEFVEQVRELNERIGKSSRNSSRPPSSDCKCSRRYKAVWDWRPIFLGGGQSRRIERESDFDLAQNHRFMACGTQELIA